ncbi:hypothetical protein ACGF3C_32590 [Micromonospora sp. NPDC047762]|uniref:hypothetical protein n=1 Tax=unclassified Micromonospora TaxID=2617518 RepID=UPI0034096BBE
MSSTYTYRLIRSSWGIRISITADPVLGAVEVDDVIAVGEDVFLADGTQGGRLGGAAMRMLARGLRSLSAEIASAAPGRVTTIVVREVSYNEADFQEEGLAAAIVGWAVAEFGLPDRDIGAFFDAEANRYIFDLWSKDQA